jgi:diguanylate cyclase (GGDEF)-like protein/PAS domain S-box-containing protein
MPPVANDVLRLLLVAHPEDAVEQLVVGDLALASRLHAHRVEDADGLRHALGTDHWDLMLARARLDGTTLSRALEAVRVTSPDLPVIAFEHTPTRDEVVEALRLGARDLVDVCAGDHLRLVIERELANLRERRARRLVDVQHREFQRQTFTLINSVSDPILILRRGHVLHANPPAIRLCGGSFEALRGRAFVELVVARDRERVRGFVSRLTTGGKLQRIDTALTTPGVVPFDVTVSFSRTSFGGQDGHLAILHGVRPTRNPRQTVYAMSQWDQLTGLHTQRHFLATLAEAVDAAGRHDQRGALLLIELENFRAMRQSVGIVASDLLVKDLASLVAHEAGEVKAIGRFGNHTFAVLIDGCDLDEATARAERLRAAVRGHISEVGEQSLATTCSVAVVPVSARSRDAEHLMREAERLCREAIEAGGDEVVCAEVPAPMAPPAVADLGEGVMRIAAEGRLFVLWQPIVHLHGGQEASYEATVAARLGDDALLDSDALHARALDDEELATLDRWLLEKVIVTAHAQQRSGRDVHLFLRLSGAAVSTESTLLHLSRLLRAYGVHRHRLTFQIPEASAHGQVRQARAFVHAARKLYCSTGLDGYGAALTSVHAVRQLGVEYVRLSPAQIEGLVRDPARRQALGNLQASLRQLGCTTLAPGVADAQTLMVLWQCGVDYAMGDYLQPPEAQMAYDFDGALEHD